MRRIRWDSFALAFAMLAMSPLAFAQNLDNGFAYQGRLTNNGALANGNYDFQFLLFLSESGGVHIGPIVASNNVPVTAGLFTTRIDFGTFGAFVGGKTWMEIRVAPAGGGAGPFTSLAPRRELVAVPNSSYAISAGQAVNLLNDLDPDQIVGDFAEDNKLHPSLVGIGTANLMSVNSLTDNGATLIGVFDGFANASGPSLYNVLSGLDSAITQVGIVSALDSPGGVLQDMLVAQSDGAIRFTMRSSLVEFGDELTSIIIPELQEPLRIQLPGPEYAFATQFQTGTSNSVFRQSFVAPQNCFLTSFDCSYLNPSIFTRPVRVYEGAGVAGTLLYNQTRTFPPVSSPGIVDTVDLRSPVKLTGGQTYTVEVPNLAAGSSFVANATNPFAGGTAFDIAGAAIAGTDMYFAFSVINSSLQAIVLKGGSSPSVGIGGFMEAENPLVVTGTTGTSANLQDGIHLGRDANNVPRIELVCNGASPYIDFSRSNSVDNDMRLAATAANELTLSGANLGIGVAPAFPLQVESSSVSSAVASLTNSSTGNAADVLNLRLGRTTSPAAGNNFITFELGNGTSVGAIEGNGTGSVVLSGAGADYAEFLQKTNDSEQMKPGDVVGIHGGRISRNTINADAVMVISSNPLVQGNDPGEENRAGWERVAFMGQADVRVRGAARAGDLLVPSTLNDGTAIAISPGEHDAGMAIVGVAWESADGQGEHLVKAAIGVSGSQAAMTAISDRLESLELRMAALEHSNGLMNKVAQTP